MKRSRVLNPLSISCLYAASAAVWIMFSDSALRAMGLPPDITYHLSVIKGVAFVMFTALLLYLLVRKMVSQMWRDRAEHEAELRESEERFSTAFNSNPDGMAISSLDQGRYIEVNQAFLNQLGYERSEVIGRSGIELGIWPDPGLRKNFAEQIQSGEVIHGVGLVARRKDGQFIDLEVSAEVIQLSGSPFLLVIGRDVSLQKRLELQFLQAQKMEALGQLAAGVAHDFKNLLMLIRGFAELLIVSDAKNVEYRRQVLDAVDKADTLTRQLLAYSRKQEVTPTVLDLNAVLSDMLRMLPQMLPRKVRVSADLQPGLWNVLADRGQLEQVVMNLAVNAQDAMPQGGSFHLATANLKLEENYLGPENIVVPVGEYVEIAAKDTGSGIRPELIGRIFEPFFTTKERGKGTGLGLAAVFGIVNQSKGYTLVQSDPGTGTAFRILLPRAVAQGDAIPKSFVRVGSS
jgi:two-component system, cell cycle sensor histidine kinase and response regulator CckA